MSGSGGTAAVRCTYLGLLLLLADDLLCSAMPSCKPGNHTQQLIERREIKLMELDTQFDLVCCNSSQWVVDEENGTLGIYFQLPKSGYLKHLILQKVLSDDEVITYTEVWFILEDFQNIDQCGYHVFEYISSGLYRLEGCYSDSKEKTINTMFNESKLNCSSGGHSINSLGEPKSRDDIIGMKMKFAYQLPRKMDRIYTMKDSNGTVIKNWAIKARKEDSENLICETNDTGVEYEPVPDNYLYEQIFEINGLYPEFYTIEVEVFGPLSVQETKLGVCVKNIVINITELYLNDSQISGASLGHTVVQQEDLPVIAMTGLAAVAVLGSLCFVIYKLLTRPPPLDKIKGYIPEQVDLTKKKVLLLYARDCPQFKDLMATLRDLLKKNNFKVYDCYDPEHSSTVSVRGPTLWMRCLVEDSSVRVIVVSTKCARLQQLALMSGGSFTYKEPHSLDRVFLYGLSSAMAIHTNTYQKIYSIVLEGFTRKEDTLNILSDRIYSLPSHLVELFRDLRHSSKPPEETEELKQHIITLKEKLDVLVRYTNIEEDYLYRTVLT